MKYLHSDGQNSLLKVDFFWFLFFKFFFLLAEIFNTAKSAKLLQMDV